MCVARSNCNELWKLHTEILKRFLSLRFDAMIIHTPRFWNQSLESLSWRGSSKNARSFTFLESPNFPKTILHLPELVGTRVFFDGMSWSFCFKDAWGIYRYWVRANFFHFLENLRESIWYLRCCGLVPRRAVNRWRGCSCRSSCDMVTRWLRKGCSRRRGCHPCCHYLLLFFKKKYWRGMNRYVLMWLCEQCLLAQS